MEGHYSTGHSPHWAVVPMEEEEEGGGGGGGGGEGGGGEGGRGFSYVNAPLVLPYPKWV